MTNHTFGPAEWDTLELLGIRHPEVLAAIDRIDQLERERDEARAEASRIEGRAVEFSRRAEKAEAAVERVTSDEFADKLEEYLTVYDDKWPHQQSAGILDLIRDTTGETP